MVLSIHNQKLYTYEWAISLLIFLMMIFPAQLYIPKIICLFLIVITMKKRMYISKTVISLIGIFILYGIWAITIALIKNTENPLSPITVAIIWPIIFIPLICQDYTNEQFLTLCRIIFAAHVFIVLYDLLYCFSIIYGYHIPSLYPEDQVFSFYETTSRLSFLNLNSITFSSPIIILLWMTGINIGIKRSILFIIVALTMFLLFLSGRRSLMGLAIAIIPISFIFSSLFNQKYQKNLRSSFILIALVTCISIGYLAVSNTEMFEGYLNTFTKAFDSDEEPTKFAQSNLLLNQFANAPIEGMGAGKVLFEPSPGRMDFRYQFELQYHLTLAQTGLVGFFLKMFFLLGTLYYGIRLGIKYNNILLIFSIGYLFILIANFTNPVLCSFDFFLSAFIILAGINSTLKKINTKSHEERIELMLNKTP